MTASARATLRKCDPTRTFALLLLTAALHAATPLQILTDTLPNATAGAPYNVPIAVAGGACPVTSGTASALIDSGTFPSGMFISSPAGLRTWTLAGTPASSSAGTYQFVLHIRWTHTATSPFDQNCVDDATKPLSLTVLAPQIPLTADRSQVAVTYRVAHFPPSPETIHVTAGSATTFTAQTATSSGGDWLSVSPVTGATPATLSVSFTPSGLAPGVYSGTVTLTPTSGPPLVIPVTLTVVLDNSIVLRAVPASLTFNFVTGGANPPAQTLAVSVTGDAVIFQADVSAPPTNKWLIVTPTGAATPATLSVTADPKGLSPGTYNGTVVLHLAFAGTAAQTIPVTFTVQAPAALPAISSNGVVNAANLTPAIAPGAWVSIFGSLLANTTRSWRDSDFVGGKLPLSLDGVSVTINGKSAPVAYISPTQLNVLAPDESATGLLFVQVKAPAGTSDSVLALEQTAAPALFQFRAPTTFYAAATHADGSYVAGAALTQQGISGTPAKPGETIVLYGTGFGATQPPISATGLVPAPLPLANPADLRVRIGGADCTIAFAGLISPGLYQFNVVVPEVPDGDRTVVLELRGLLTRSDLLLSVQH